MERIYELMHGERVVARIAWKGGLGEVCAEQFLPYDLYLDEEDDIDTRINNLQNFHHWCANRVLTLDRIYAKEIMNSIGVKQATTDRDRAEIALAYHCVSLTDIYWVREAGDSRTFADVNLYDNHLDEALVDISLCGKQMSVTNTELAQDLSTRGCFPKAWIRDAQGFVLLKDGGEEVVRRELLASRICQCFDIPQVVYEPYQYKHEVVSRSRLVTDKKHGLVQKASFDIYAINHNLDPVAVCQELDAKAYFGMNIVDYLVGNTDRHPENWGLLMDNTTNQPMSLYPLMDFNQSFLQYDDLDGANCQTVLPRRLTQREAAEEAVREVGLLQRTEVDLSWFGEHEQWREVFCQRLRHLKQL